MDQQSKVLPPEVSALLKERLINLSDTHYSWVYNASTGLFNIVARDSFYKMKPVAAMMFLDTKVGENYELYMNGICEIFNEISFHRKSSAEGLTEDPEDPLEKV